MFKPLRDKILELAITGKLVPQLESEPDVEQIGPAPAEDEEPFALPKKWKWVRLGLLGSWKSGQTPKRTEQSYWVSGSISWLKTGELNDGVISFSEEKISQKAVDDLNIRVNPVDSVLIAMYGATAGRLGVLSTPCATNQACCACIVDTQLLVNWFLFYVLLAFRAELIGMATGTAQSNLSKEKIEALWFPLPPLEEQRRIVAKLDDIMGNLERMDQAYTELSGPMVKHFKNLVLQQAISGQLVPQLDSEPAVEQIGLALDPDDVPFELPEKWKWVQASHLGSWKSGSTPNRSNKMYWDNGSINWLKTGELQDRLITFTEEKITTQAVEELNIRINPAGAFLVAMYGATAGKIGILKIPSTTNQACCACIVNDSIIINWFLFYAFLAFRASLVSKAGGSAQPNLSKEKVIKSWIPLPPLEEQRRIVARIEELFGDVDKLLEWQQFA